ncbi:MAG: hypothetical protein M3485_03485 [Pseudomonadota bacterium]|nr:hypothetical protein [Pseudomonadota bacterium]
MNILGVHYLGKDEAERRRADLFSSIFKGSKLELTFWKVRPLGDSVAVVETILELRGFKQLPPRPTIGSDVLRTRMKYVFAKEDDRWLSVSAQNTAMAPTPSLSD